MKEFQRVLVCFATNAEAAAFRKPARALGDVTILITGMGPENARAAIRSALDGRSIDLVLSAGFAGGLDPSLARGTPVFACDEPDLCRELAALTARQARFLTSTAIATTAAEKLALRSSTHADAVEMESGALQAECSARGIPFAIARVISDAADEDLPLDFNELMTSEMKLSYLRLALHLARSPGKIGKLRAFGKQVAVCARTQASLLESLIQKLRTRGSAH